MLLAVAWVGNNLAVRVPGRYDGRSLMEKEARPTAETANLFTPSGWAFVIWAPIFLGEWLMMLCAPPLMHGTALSLAIGAFVMGGSVVLLGGRSFDAEELWRLVEKHRVTQLSIVGDAFARPMTAALEPGTARSGRDLSSMKRISSTGATLSADQKRRLQAAMPQAAIIDMIGASEGGPFAIAMTMPGDEPPETAVFTALQCPDPAAMCCVAISLACCRATASAASANAACTLSGTGGGGGGEGGGGGGGGEDGGGGGGGDRDSSAIVFGGVDSSRYEGDIHWIPLQPSPFWQVGMSDVLLDGIPLRPCVRPDGCRVAIDSGTSLFTGLASQIRRITRRLQRRQCWWG